MCRRERDSAKRETRKAWDLKWGRLGREGNLWWLGSKRANWEMVMGQHKLGWFREFSHISLYGREEELMRLRVG